MTKMKNCQNFAIFGQNAFRFCNPAESSQNGPLLFFDQKNSFTNKMAGGHFVFLPKTRFFDFGGPLRAPKIEFFPESGLKGCIEHF